MASLKSTSTFSATVIAFPFPRHVAVLLGPRSRLDACKPNCLEFWITRRTSSADARENATVARQNGARQAAFRRSDAPSD